MKKSSKVMLLTAAVVGVVGIGMSIGGVAMGYDRRTELIKIWIRWYC